MEEECTHLQMMYQSSQEEIEQLAERSDEHIQEIRDLNDKIQVYFTLCDISHHVSCNVLCNVITLLLVTCTLCLKTRVPLLFLQ